MPGLAVAQHAKLPRTPGLDQRGQGLLFDGFFQVVTLRRRYGLTIAQGAGSAQRADLVASILSVCYQGHPACGGLFTITSNSAQAGQ